MPVLFNEIPTKKTDTNKSLYKLNMVTEHEEGRAEN